MKLTVRQLLNSERALGVLSTTERLPGHTSFRIARIIKNAGKAINDFRKAHLDLVKQYGEEVENVNNSGQAGWQVLDDKMPEFQPLYEQLLDEAVEFPVTPLTLEDFGKAEIQPIVFVEVDWLLAPEVTEEAAPEPAEFPAEKAPLKLVE